MIQSIVLHPNAETPISGDVQNLSNALAAQLFVGETTVTVFVAPEQAYKLTMALEALANKIHHQARAFFNPEQED